MKVLSLIAVLAGSSWAANIKTVPLEIVQSPVNGPAAAPINPLLPTAPLLPDSAVQLKVPTLAPIPALAASKATEIRRQAAASDPGNPTHSALPQAEASGETRPENTAKETAEELVRRLMSRGRAEREELAAAFDGEAALAMVGMEAPVDGEVRKTRHGEYTLAFSEVSEDGDRTILLERWEGPNGGLWLEHKRGPDLWQVREYRGRHRPMKVMPPSAYAEFEISMKGRMISNVETAPAGRPSSVMINAKQAFKDAVAYLDEQVAGIKGTWAYGTNLKEFNRLTGEGKPPEEAALGTWTGQQAAALGYTKVVFSGEGLKHLQEAKPGQYEKMSALFLKP